MEHINEQLKTERTDLFSADNNIGREYDFFKLAIPHHDEFQEQLGFCLENYFSVETTPEILEIGSGTGETTKEIFKKVPNAHVVALDKEVGMIKQAQDKNFEGEIVFVAEDSLVFLKNVPEHSYDSVVSAYTLHNFTSEYRQELISEIYRTLKPGGVFINADKYALDDEEEYKDMYNKQLKAFDVFDDLGKSELKKEWLVHYENDNFPSIQLVEGVFKQKLLETGFINIKTVYRKMLEAVIVAEKK